MLILAALAVLVLLSNLYCLRRMRRAESEALAANTKLVLKRLDAKAYQSQAAHWEARATSLKRSLEDLVLFSNSNVIHVGTARFRAKHWKSLALALEVFCECCADSDRSGAENARKEIERERRLLRQIGEYNG